MEHNVSKAQLEVWEWKEKAVASVEHLPLSEQIAAIIERATQTTEHFIKAGDLKLKKPIQRRGRIPQ